MQPTLSVSLIGCCILCACAFRPDHVIVILIWWRKQVERLRNFSCHVDRVRWDSNPDQPGSAAAFSTLPCCQLLPASFRQQVRNQRVRLCPPRIVSAWGGAAEAALSPPPELTCENRGESLPVRMLMEPIPVPHLLNLHLHWKPNEV